MANKFDENYEKPSKHQQYNERASRPVETKTMTKAEINTYKKALLESYECENVNDITYEFIKIKDEYDEDRNDCLEIIYFLKCYRRNGEEYLKEIRRVKITIPEELKQTAEAMQRQKRSQELAQRRRLPAPENNAQEPAQTTSQTRPTIFTQNKPVLRKPTTKSGNS